MKYSAEHTEEFLKEQGIVGIGGSWDNSGNAEVQFYKDDPNPLIIIKRPRFDLFRCYWCLNLFKDWDRKEMHEEICPNHLRGYSTQMENT